jgi:uncharacterized protein (TIGR02466 family)
MSNGKIGYYFPTAIESSSELELAEKLLPIARKYLSDETFLTNTWNYKNTFGTRSRLSNLPDMMFFVNFIKNKTHSFLNNCGYDTSSLNFNVQLFFSEMFDGDSHARHVHKNCLLSGLLYLQVPENSASLIVHDPRPHRKFQTYQELQNPINITNPEVCWDAISFKPEVGKFLMWESWLEHEVLINRSVEGRMTAVFNVSEVNNDVGDIK